ncbi:MAG TPA: M13 family metallopeptidase [Terriglobales bacterium]|nr:M13 family metallopeptidase [Terriglobales bacterium]
MRSLVVCFAWVCLFCSESLAQTTTAPREHNSEQPPPALDHFDASKVATSIDPCTDFYEYSCHRWVQDNPVPPDEIFWGASGKLQLWNEAVLHQTVLAIAAKPVAERTPVEQKVGDYWAACMDEKQRKQTALETLRPGLERIDHMRSKAEIAEIVADLHLSIYGAWNPSDPATYAALFGFGAQPDFHDTANVIPQFDQGGMGLPGRDFYLKTDAESLAILTKYKAHVARMLELSGEPVARAQSAAEAVLNLETAMAKSAMDVVKRRDPKNLDNEMGLAEVEKLAPNFDFARYLEGVNAPPSGKFIVTSPEFFRSLERLIQDESLAHWKSYLKWQLLAGSASQMSDDFVQEDFEFVGKTLFGAKAMLPLWRRCVQAEDRDLGQALGQAYVARAFPAANKERVKQIVQNLEAALGSDIDASDWMSPETKKQAHLKLAMQVDKIGYPDHWRDYSALEIRPDNHLENVRRAAAFEFHRQLQKIGKPLDRSEWTMTPPTVNAYEDAQTNTINFPAGILEPPFYDPTQDDSVNYGAVGAVIGHETIHGFDDQGRKFDGSGNLRDWWTSTDAQAYDQRGDCIREEYTEFVPEAGVQQDGRLTQGENTADNGGIYLALFALEADLQAKGEALDSKGQDGLTARQRFFLAYAGISCSNVRPEMMRTLLLMDPHPLDKYRVNNVVSNMPEFAQAFSCHKGQPMVRKNACRLW